MISKNKAFFILFATLIIVLSFSFSYAYTSNYKEPNMLLKWGMQGRICQVASRYVKS